MQKNILVALGVLLGIVFLIAAFLYFTLPAHALPSFFPGYDATLSKIHKTHAIGSLGLALVSFAFAWMSSGKKSSK